MGDRPVRYRAGLGDPIAASDADAAIGPLDKHNVQVVALPEDSEASIVVYGRPLNGLEQRREFRFRRREDGNWIDVTTYTRPQVWGGMA